MIYLDYQATTPLAPEAREAMIAWLGGPDSETFANPHSPHRMGRMAAAAVEVARIKAAESVLKDYFAKVFAERRSNFEELFNRLDGALEANDGETVALMVRGIVDIAKTSPLADLGDLSQIRAALDDPDQVWEL